ncbi:PAS domain S-box protein [delta proteobacterium NaphS2]|nr:PAS domain S-box protein [delta proteobacterium NaphS2]
MLKKVLAVDNDPFILEFMKDILSSDRYELFTANDGLEALDVMDKTTPDIIFVDLVMPNIGGKKLCRIIRGMERLKDAFVVILSSAIEEQGIDAEKLGVNACITKGPMEDMARHIRWVLESPDVATRRCAKGEILGADKNVKRRITNELLSMGKHNEAILDVMHEGIMEVVSKGKIVYANPMCQELLGIPERKLLGTDFFQLFSQTDRPKVHASLRKTAAAKSLGPNCLVRVNDRELVLRILPVKNQDRLSFIILLQDITEKRRMEAKLVQAEKREALGTLAGGIAHNFNNLLTAIQGYVSLLTLKDGLTQAHLDDLHKIQQCVRSGSDLTSELLKIAKGDGQKLRTTDLNGIVKKSSEMFGAGNKQIQIHQKYQKGIWLVDADVGQLEQVFLNLYINAQQAMPGGGDLFLETENVTLKEKCNPSAGIRGRNYVKVSVRDTGKGIDRNIQEKIFDPFFTTKNMGSGLGLSTAQNTLKSHKGMINVHSDRGKGTTFEIFLPASHDSLVMDNPLGERRVSPDAPFFSWKSERENGFLEAAGGY